MTAHQHDIPHSNRLPVLACEKEMCKDQYNHPAESGSRKDHIAISLDLSEECNIINIYSVDEEQS